MNDAGNLGGRYEFPNVWPFGNSAGPDILPPATATYSLPNMPEDESYSPAALPETITPRFNIYDERLTPKTHQCMARMAVAATLWPGIDRSDLGRAARVAMALESRTFIIGALSHVLDISHLGPHACKAGIFEHGERALLQRVCLRPAMGTRYHNFVYAPAPQLAEIAQQPKGTAPWLDAALGELADANFVPENLAEIIERQRKIKFLTAQ